ncbi:hypothetical protein KI688_009675 [Linnemannia hyalina]|uniref:Calponin-homology (CH) domain-containing protein n=1 Tax=Linnemannia hyalina TaxID=64524 RepID=A0A9P7Y134_9FUNG|nr:hypothetical protein KI688_009675 [Linnemannia hyalina]
MASRGTMRPPNAPLHQQQSQQQQQQQRREGHNIPTGTNNENVFKAPSLLGLPSSIKRKPSHTELNPNAKVHLRRQSTTENIHNNSNGGATTNATTATTTSNITTTPTVLGTRPLSSLDHDANTAALPTLILAPFEPSPWLEFGKVVVGSKKTVSMMVENPGETTERLVLDPGCKMEEKGFNILQLDPLHTAGRANTVESLTLGPKSKMELTITWTPLVAGSVRASALLRTSNGRCMVNLRGTGDVPIPEYQSLGSSTRKMMSASTRSVKDLGASVFQPKSSTLKQSMMRHSVARTALPNTSPAPGGYSTLPYVTSNEMYDEKWIDKQERSFSQWLNYEFHVTVDSFSPKDPSSWSYYSHKFEYEHTRAAAFKIYQSDSFRIVLRKVEESIARDRLQLRADCNFAGDVAARREVIDLFFSFDIRWLVLGLETITGKATAINPNFDRPTISGFINKAVFHDKQIEAELEPDRVLSNRPKFYQTMNRLILKRIFMLILFLDKAKTARLIPSDPCLFNKDSDIKSCRTLLLTISKTYLMGEGDIIRHLIFMGYSVIHNQAPLDEFDFTVKNLAVDLRDGVRLCRLIDLHCPELSLSQKMKFPTLSKTHMQQNVNLALSALVTQGISLEGTRGGVVTPRDIVEGHREKTFGLLWKLILNWKVAVLVDLSVLEAEIAALKAEYKRIYGVDQPDRVDTVYFTSDQLSALLRWCQAIGAFYNLSINNFTTSFADGRGFGALLSYYHPTLLDMTEMKDSARFLSEYKQGMHQPELEITGGADGKGWFIDTKDVKDPITQSKEMDRFNYRLLHTKVQALGGVPITLRHADMSNVGVPDEKAVILFVTYLCARLMHLNKDIRAAKTIQRIWRKKHYGRKEETRVKATVVIQKHIRRYLSGRHVHKIKEQKIDAALLIQTGCRAYLAQTRAIQKMETVMTLQTQCRAFLARKQFLEMQWAALTVQRYYRGHATRQHYAPIFEEYRSSRAIQAQARGYIVRKQFLLLRIAAEIVQSRRRALVEGRRVRQLYIEIVSASVVIQRTWKATVAGRAVRQQFVQLRSWAVALQAQVRSKLERHAFLEKQWAAVIIQRRWRMRALAKNQQLRYQELQWAARTIQAGWRAVVARRDAQYKYQTLQWTVVQIQTTYRAKVVQFQYRQLRAAAIAVQHRRRALVEGREQEYRFLQIRAAVRVIQDRRRALLQGRKTRQEYQELRSTFIRFQAAIRGYLLRQRLIKVMQENQAAMTIQAAWRGHVQRKAYLRTKAASIVIQQKWRAVQHRRREQHMYDEYRWAAIVTQRWWRACKAGHETRQQYRKLREASIAVQSIYRGQVARREALGLQTIVRVQAMVRARFAQWQYERLRLAALVVQTRWRARQSGIEQRIVYDTMVHASILIQRKWRAVLKGRQVRQAYQAARALVVATQSHARGALVRKQYQDMRWAAVTIQKRWRARVQGQEQRRVYLEQWKAARTIQTTWRAVQLGQQQRHAYLDLRWAAIVMQRARRDVVQTRAMNMKIAAERQAAALLIQTGARGFLTRKRIIAHLEDRERIMSRWVEVSSASFAAIRIQRAWRSYQIRKMEELYTFAAIKIQRWWRDCQEQYTIGVLNQLTLQMQTQIHGVLARRRALRRMDAIVKVQSWWRGHVVRQDCTAKIKAARKRIEHANATAEEHMKLGNRTTMALDILLSSGQLSAVLKACYHLDVVTRLSKNSCLRLVEHNVVNIIFQLIKSCNRSQPHMEVLKHSLNILENLSWDRDTTGSVFWAPDGLEILVDTAQSYRENDMVFDSTLTIMLIHLDHEFLTQRQIQQQIQPDMDGYLKRRRVFKAMANEAKKLRGILTVMERKLERETRGKPPLTATRMRQLPQNSPLRALVTSVNKLRRIGELVF